MNIKRAGSLFFSGVLLGLVVFVGVSSVPARAQATPFGNQIVCFVFNSLNNVGSPLPVLNADGCTATSTPSTGSLKVIKIVRVGTKNSWDFTMHVLSDGRDIAGSPRAGSLFGTVYTNLAPGTYAVSEDSDTGYTRSFSGDCAPAGAVTVSAGASAVCTVTNTAVVVPPPGSENTLALCSDGIDNNSNGLVDLADPSCAAFIPKLTVTKVVVNDNGGTGVVSNFPLFVDGISIVSGVSTSTTVGAHVVTETASSSYKGTFSGDCDATGHVTLAIGDNKTCTLTNDDIAPATPPATTQCNDGIDNDDDGLIDSADPGCHTDFNAGNSASYDATRNDESAMAPTGGGGGGDTNTPPPSGGGDTNTPPPSGGGGGGGIISGPLSYGYGGGGGYVLGTSTGAVLGTSTSCGLYLTNYLRIGRPNSADQVIKLQTFLNNNLGLTLPVTGFFGTLTDAAVRKFQTQYTADVLTPWVPYGLGVNETTGYVYKTTQRKINLIMCSELNLPMPLLP